MQNKCSYWDCKFTPCIITDKDEVLRTFMHYTDPEANKPPITVFGQESYNLFYNYSDRFDYYDWMHDAEYADLMGLEYKTARWFETVLQHIHSATKLDLQHIMLGVNRSSGYHYLIFGYTYEN